MDNGTLMLGIIVGFWFFLIVMLYGVLHITAWISGWQYLSKTYHTTQAIKPNYTYLSGMVGWISYNNILQIGVTAAGLYLALPKFFSFGHKPLFIPWKHVKYVGTIKVLWQPRIHLQVDGKTLLLSGKCANDIKNYLH